MCSLALRSAARASRICGCGSAGVAVAGVAGRAFAAGVAGALALLGAAGAVAMNANARIKDARANSRKILVLMNHSSRPHIGSDRRIVPLLSICVLRHRGATNFRVVVLDSGFHNSRFPTEAQDITPASPIALPITKLEPARKDF